MGIWHAMFAKPEDTENFFLVNCNQSGITLIHDSVTGIPFSHVNDGADLLSVTTGKFGNGVFCNGQSTAFGDSYLVSRTASDAWDVDSYAGDYTIHMWVKFGVPQTRTAQIFAVQKESYDSNNFVSITIPDTDFTTPNYRVTGAVSIGENFIGTFFYSIPIADIGTTDFHHIALGRVLNNHYITVNGGAATVDSVLTTSYRDPAGKRRLVIGNGNSNSPVQAVQFNGVVDEIHGYKGQLFDFVSGFTPPALPPHL